MVWPMPTKTAKKAENHSKEGPINTTVGKSGIDIQVTKVTQNPQSFLLHWVLGGRHTHRHLASIVDRKSTRKKTSSGRTNSKESCHQCLL